MAKLRVEGEEELIDAPAGVSLLRALQEARHPIATSCGGRASCGLCRVTILAGQEHLNPLTPAELPHLGNVARVIGTRLACQTFPAEEAQISLIVPPVRDPRLRRSRTARFPREQPSPAPPPVGFIPQERVKITQDKEQQESARTVGSGSPKIEWRPRKLQGIAAGEGKGKK